MARNDNYSWSDLRRLRDAVAASAPDTALEILSDIAHDVKVGSPISAIVETDDDRLGHTIAGVILRHHAFIARGARIAEHTSDARFSAYATIDERARYHLERAVQLAPDDGLSLGVMASFIVEEPTEGKAAFEALLLQSPTTPAASWCDVLQGWSYKWGGSQDQMWQCLNRLWREDDPRCWALVARATFEEWLYNQVFRPARETHFSLGVPRSAPLSLGEAAERALDTRDDPANPGLMRFVHGWFGRVYWDRRDHKRAKRHLARTRAYMDPTIWIYGSALMSASQRFRLAKLQSGLF